MGLASTKADSDGLSASFGCLYIFSKAYLKNFFEYIYSTLFN